MKRGTKWTTAMLASALAASVAMTGCSNDKEAASSTSPAASPGATAAASAKPELKEVKLKVYGMTWGELKADNKLVMDEVNKLLKQKINATIEYTIDMSTDTDKKVPLMIASGEDYDGIQMNAAIFQSEVAKGGIREVGDLLKQYMPLRMKGATDYDLKDVTYDGKLYGIPGGAPSFIPQGWIIRGDLREKYNIPEVKDLAGLKTYLSVLKEKEPSVIPFNSSAGDNITLGQALIQKNGFISITGSLFYQFNADKVTAQFDYELPQFKEYLALTKEFTDKGYWSKNAYASKTLSLDGFKSGTSFLGTGHSVSANDTSIILKTTKPDWKVEFVRIDNNYRDRPSRGMAFAIPKSAKNPERLMMALELFQNDPEINSLLEYGIKDVHYTLTADGAVKPTKQGTDSYPPDQFPLIWTSRNAELIKKVDGSIQNLTDFQKKENIEKFSVVNKLAGFIIKKDAIAAEFAAVSEVATTFKPLINFGGFENVDAFLKEYSDKMKAAGAEKVKAEVQKQIDAFMAAKK
ncbi:MAG: hypothetical protein K0R57_231 [Paenibacillaceae bacterium]|jgi:putative aldouronate transport system substrate-binding protein|nr:hypothetical protein [Paenibacillaceae bacterium]